MRFAEKQAKGKVAAQNRRVKGGFFDEKFTPVR
jgi:hypothetical protein